MKNEIKDKLRALRLEAGYTQKEMGQKISSTDKNIWAYEKGLATPPVEVLVAYAKTFNVSTDYLLGLEDDFGIKVESSEGLSVNAQEKELLTLFRQLSPYLQGLTLDTVRGWAGGSGSAKSNLQKKA